MVARTPANPMMERMPRRAPTSASMRARMESLEQMMARHKEMQAQQRGKSAEAPGQRKKALGLRSARTLAPGYGRRPTASQRAASQAQAAARQKKQAAMRSPYKRPRGTQT